MFNINLNYITVHLINTLIYLCINIYYYDKYNN